MKAAPGRTGARHRRERPVHDACYICGQPATERDHFPVPQSMGGDAVEPICRGCHDSKDRIPLDTWNPTLAFDSLSGLWAKATHLERLMLAKLFHISSQGLATLQGQGNAV